MRIFIVSGNFKPTQCHNKQTQMALSLNMQKEKEWDNVIKQKAKTKGWTFKGWFAYKAVKDFFYEATFYISAFDNSVYGSLEFKPLIIDDTFWEIVDLKDNGVLA